METKQASDALTQLEKEKVLPLLASQSNGNKTVEVELNICTSSKSQGPKANARKVRNRTEMSGEEMQVSSTVSTEITSDDPTEGDTSNERMSDPGTPLQDEPGANNSDGEIDGSPAPSSPSLTGKTKISSDAEAKGIRKNEDDDHVELDYNEDSEGDGELSSDSEQRMRRPPPTEIVKSPVVKEDDDEKEEGEHDDDDGELSDSYEEDCEDGEIKDHDTPRQVSSGAGKVSAPPPSQFPPNVCRFFLRGNCTWGMSCRYFHPAPPDKAPGLPMPVPMDLEMLPQMQIVPPGRRPIGPWNPRLGMMLPGPEFDHPMPPMPPPPPMVEPVPQESAWERGLRCAKEMLRKATKRKEEEENFEEKRLNLRTDDATERTENKENEKTSSKDPYYDDVRDNMRGREDVMAEDAWHGGRYENFEVRWMKGGESYCMYKDKENLDGRYEKSGFGADARYDRMREENVPRHRADEWRDPWVRSRSPRQHHSVSRSRSRGSRVRYSSRSVSYSSRSRSSRSRKGSKSSLSSRSSYSSSSSRSTSRSRSRSIPVKRPSGTTLAEDMKAKLAAESNKVKKGIIKAAAAGVKAPAPGSVKTVAPAVAKGVVAPVGTKGVVNPGGVKGTFGGNARPAMTVASRLPSAAIPLKTQMQMSLTAAKGGPKVAAAVANSPAAKAAEPIVSRPKSHSSLSGSSSSSPRAGRESRSSSSSSSDSDNSARIITARHVSGAGARLGPAAVSLGGANQSNRPHEPVGIPLVSAPLVKAETLQPRDKQKLLPQPVPPSDNVRKPDLKAQDAVDIPPKAAKEPMEVPPFGVSRETVDTRFRQQDMPMRTSKEPADVRGTREFTEGSSKASRDKQQAARGDREMEFTTRGGKETIAISFRNVSEPMDISSPSARVRGAPPEPRASDMPARGGRDSGGDMHPMRGGGDARGRGGGRGRERNDGLSRVDRGMMNSDMPLRGGRDGGDGHHVRGRGGAVHARGGREMPDAPGRASREPQDLPMIRGDRGGNMPSVRGPRDSSTEMYARGRGDLGDMRGRVGEMGDIPMRGGNRGNTGDLRAQRPKDDVHMRGKRDPASVQNRGGYDGGEIQQHLRGNQAAVRSGRYEGERLDRDEMLLRGREDIDVPVRSSRGEAHNEMPLRGARDGGSRDDLRSKEGTGDMQRRMPDSGGRVRGVPAGVPPPVPLSQQPQVPMKAMASSYGHHSTSGPASVAAAASTKDPMKISGQKSGIKLTLRNEKRMLPVGGGELADRKRLAEDSHYDESRVKRSSRDDHRLSKGEGGSKADSHSGGRGSGARRDSTSSRRDELLRQLKAVEEAIHRKRNK